MVSAILAAQHRTFVLVVTSLFVLFVFLCTINFFFFFMHLVSIYCLFYFTINDSAIFISHTVFLMDKNCKLFIPHQTNHPIEISIYLTSVWCSGNALVLIKKLLYIEPV